MFELDEIKECVNTVKKNLDDVIEKVFVTIQENVQSVEKNKTDISDILRKLDVLIEDKNVSEDNAKIKSADEEVCYEKISDLINEAVKLCDVEISLYKDAVGIKTSIGNKVFNIEDFDFYSRTGKEKKVLKNFKIFVKSGGCVSEEIFLNLKCESLYEVRTCMGHFNTNLKRVFNIKEKGGVYKKVRDKYNLRFKVCDKMDVGFFKSSTMEKVSR